MKENEFWELHNDLIDKIQETMMSKNSEYAREDMLSNIKGSAALLGTTPEKATMSLVSKHIVALCAFVNDLDKGIVQPLDRWDEKITDTIIYMILLYILRREKNGK